MNENRRRSLLTKKRRRIALELRINGWTYRRIAGSLGIAPSSAMRLCQPPKSVSYMVHSRAQGKCESCGQSAQEGNVHHIRIRVEEMEDYNKIENLVYLCASCHNKVHALAKRDNTARAKVLKTKNIKRLDIKKFVEHTTNQAELISSPKSRRKFRG